MNARLWVVVSLVHLICYPRTLVSAEVRDQNQMLFLVGTPAQEIRLDCSQFSCLTRASGMLRSIPCDSYSEPYLLPTVEKSTFEDLIFLACLPEKAFDTQRLFSTSFKSPHVFEKTGFVINSSDLNANQIVKVASITTARLINLIKASDFLDMPTLLATALRTFCYRAYHKPELKQLVADKGYHAFDFPAEVKESLKKLLFSHAPFGSLTLEKADYKWPLVFDTNTFNDSGTVLAHAHPETVVLLNSDNKLINHLPVSHVIKITFDHLGTVCACERRDGCISIHALNNPSRSITIPTRHAPLLHMAFTTDGTQLVLLSSEKARCICRVTGKELSVKQAPEQSRWCCMNNRGSVFGYSRYKEPFQGFIEDIQNSIILPVTGTLHALNPDGTYAVVSDGMHLKLFHLITRHYVTLDVSPTIDTHRQLSFSTDNALLVIQDNSPEHSSEGLPSFFVVHTSSGNCLLQVEASNYLMHPAVCLHQSRLSINVGGRNPHIQTIRMPRADEFSLETLMAFYTIKTKQCPITQGYLPALYADLPQSSTPFLTLSVIDRIRLYIAHTLNSQLH